MPTPVTDYRNYVTMAVAKGSPLKPFLNFVLMRYKQRGGLEYLRYAHGVTDF